MPDPGDFYDVQSGGAAQFQLQHVEDRDFKLLRQFGYVDLMPPHHVFIVPKDLKKFRTDLASTPDQFTWLIPGIGVHLPAILLHDGLVYSKKEGKSYIGPDIDRPEADRIFRDAMKALGTGPVRRWLIWAAVTLATAWHEHRIWKFMLVATVAIMFGLGTMATLDLLDVVAFYPWMGTQWWGREVLGGGVAALVAPFIISVPWLIRKRYYAMVIASIAFAFLIHVTLVITVLLGVYKLFEALAWRLERSSREHQRSPAPQRVYEKRSSGIAS